MTSKKITDKNYQYHIQCKSGDLAKSVLLPGDPARIEKIGSFWDEYHEVGLNRQYKTSRGLYQSVNISGCSFGVGSPSIEIALHELAEIGTDTFVRVGTTGSLVPGINCGDLIIPMGAVRLEGASKLYVQNEYPAFANYEVSLALIEACEILGFTYHIGLAACPDSFYLGQGRKGYKEYWPSWAEDYISDLVKAGVTNFEMETATVFVLSSIMGLRAGSIMGVIANRYDNTWEDHVDGSFKSELNACHAACEAVKILSQWDTIKNTKGKKYFYPQILSE